MRGYQSMTIDDYYKLGIIIPIEILPTYEDEEILELIEHRKTHNKKVKIILEDKSLVDILEYFKEER